MGSLLCGAGCATGGRVRYLDRAPLLDGRHCTLITEKNADRCTPGLAREALGLEGVHHVYLITDYALSNMWDTVIEPRVVRE